MMPDLNEAIDWQDRPVSCEGCTHCGLLGEKRCQPKHACVRDRYARRIDRFFDWNPGLANDYLTHPYFEVRAIAAKSADLFLLPALLADPDETVRWNAVRRLPMRYLLAMRNDPHREVRVRVATLLEPEDLVSMIRDEDYYVRLVCARRLGPGELTAMIADKEPEVRRVVASRVEPDALWRLLSDPDGDVRLAVARRLSPVELIGFHRDVDWRVRYEAASRMVPGMLAAMIDDEDEIVRELVLKRIETQRSFEIGGNVVPFTARGARTPKRR